MLFVISTGIYRNKKTLLNLGLVEDLILQMNINLYFEDTFLNLDNNLEKFQ